MGLAHSRTQTIITEKFNTPFIFILGPNSNLDHDPKVFSPPNQFKFSKVQRLKLTVIQAALTPKETNHDITIEEDSDTFGPLQRIASDSSFNINDPEESFMATISALIASLNHAASMSQIPDDFNRNLLELIKLFTTVFLKNINIKGLIDIFEFQVDEKVVSEHLLTAYINFICAAVNEEILRSFLVLISSILNNALESKQSRYFHLFLTQRLSSDHLSNLIESLINLICIFNYKSVGFIGGSVPIISEKSRLASQILVSLFLNNQSEIFQVIKRSDDLKSFALFIKFQSQIFQNSFPQHLNLNDFTILTILSYSLTNFCSNYRRFLLSKLDNEEVLICICKAMYQLLRGKLKNKTLLSLNLYFLSEILLSFTEDATFIKQIFETDLDRNFVRWYERDLGTTSSLGGFVFCILFDLFGANLAPSDGLKDEHFHNILKSILANLAQYAIKLDNRCLVDRFWSLFNSLLPQIYKEASIDSHVSKCLVDVLIIFSNLILNNPQGNSFLIAQFTSDKTRIISFLRAYLDHIDSSTNSQLAAHLNESELEFTAILVGILKFFSKLLKHIETGEYGVVFDIQSSLATFPMPTFRRDSRGEVSRLGSRMKIYLNQEDWIKFIEQQVWSIIYSTISWNNFVE